MATHPTRRGVPFAVCLVVVAASCADAPPPAAHSHRFTTTVTVTDDALLPATQVVIPAMSTVVWRNRTANDLTVHLESLSCPRCDTVFGFVPGEKGARSATIKPGCVATLCFHAQGSYPFLAKAGGIEHHGAIDVGELR